MLTAEQEVIGQGLINYRQDPIGFMTNVLSVKPENVWSGPRRVAESVRDNQFTIVPAGHSVSKTYIAGRLAVWFKSCFTPSTVITTAPSDNQVKNQLWREIHAAYAGAKIPLGGDMTTLKWDVKPCKEVLESLPPEEREQWEKNFAIGFSTSPDTVAEHATKMAGWHNKWMLIIIDEGCGIAPQIWRTAIEALATNVRVKVLGLGNPTDPNSEFASACKPDSGWNVVRISSMDSPNYIEKREVIPNLASYEWVEGLRKKYGTNGNGFMIRVTGQFPTFKEGTYYGYELSQAKEGERVGAFPADPTCRVHWFGDLGDMNTAGIFAQFKQGMIRIVDCYWDPAGMGIPAVVKAMDAKEYLYGKEHYAGPDLVGSNEKSAQTGKTMRDVAAALGLNLLPVIPHRFDDGIEAVRSIWKLLQINKPLCKVLLQAAAGYGKKKNAALSTDDHPVYHDHPSKSWERHMMDALRHLAVYYRYMTEEGDMGYAHVPREEPGERATDPWEYDPLGRS